MAASSDIGAVEAAVRDVEVAESLLSELDTAVAPQAADSSIGLRRKILFVGLGSAAALVGTVSMIRGSALGPAVAVQVQPILRLDGEKLACAAEGQNCHASQCCVDGGAEGLQCFQKDKFYAQCLRNATCTPGVQPGETHGTWGDQGTFQLDEWSCKKLGERSEPGCDIFEKEADCPDSRCSWFRSGKCMAICSQFGDAMSCPTTHCAWDGEKCEVDPCSAPGEDCGSTKCCSSSRGAGGQQCFRKDESWSTCMDFCDSNSTWTKGWACEKLGERKRFSAPCSWAGDDCSMNHCCGNMGFSCVVKDDTYTGCVQTVKHSTWMDMPVDLPEGWKGTVVGKWNQEYAVSAAAPGAPLAGVSLFCFMAVLPNSTEEALLAVSKKESQSIFACNASAVYHSWKSSFDTWDTGAATLVNTAVFYKIWDLVRQDGIYSRYDWTVKVDADAAFLPDRLRSQLWGIRVPAGAAVYLKNTELDAGLSNGQFLGAIEIFSRKAVQIYFDNAKGCMDSMGQNSGEDGFMKGCMDALGVGFMKLGSILKPDFASSYCKNKNHVVFHPLKDPAVLKNCYNWIFGRSIDWAHNTAQGVER